MSSLDTLIWMTGVERRKRASQLEVYVRGIKRRKTPLSEKKLRLAWGEEHEH